MERARALSESQDDTDIKMLLRDSVTEEVSQGFRGGSTLCHAEGNALALPNDNVSDCSQRVNESNLEEYTDHSDM